MTRREMFSLLAGLSAGGAVVSALEPPIVEAHPLTTLDAFNQQFKGYQEAERWGQFSVFFTGLKPAQDTTILAGQWFGWPGSWLPVEKRRLDGQWYISAVPGRYAKQYFPGEVFPTGPWGPGPKMITNELLRNDPALVMKMITDARLLLRDTMRAQGAI